jgi:hypothetical protein
MHVRAFAIDFFRGLYPTLRGRAGRGRRTKGREGREWRGRREEKGRGGREEGGEGVEEGKAGNGGRNCGVPLLNAFCRRA